MAWTTVPKPGAQTWSPINVIGKQQYDQVNLTYDDVNTFYDGGNPNMWTDIPKPSGGVFIRSGMATGLIMPVSYSQEVLAGDPWVKVSKPT